MTFPGSTPSIPTVLTTETLKTAGGATSNGMQVLLNKIRAEMIAVADKLGYSAAVPIDTPTPDRVLGSDLGGKSKWMQVVTAMIAAGAVSQPVLKQERSTLNVTSTSYVDIMTQAITTLAGSSLLVWGSSSFRAASGSPTSWWISLRLDSGADTDLTIGTPASGGQSNGSFVLFTGVTAGSHTLALRGAMTPSGTVETYYRNLLILEMKK